MSQGHFYIGGWSKTNRSIRTGVFGVDNPVENLKWSITTENVKSGAKVDIERYRCNALLLDGQGAHALSTTPLLCPVVDSIHWIVVNGCFRRSYVRYIYIYPSTQVEA